MFGLSGPSKSCLPLASIQYGRFLNKENTQNLDKKNSPLSESQYVNRSSSCKDVYQARFLVATVFKNSYSSYSKIL
eukprot:m.26947 g.26947  ORF g.26947 m.26947 type:complete len:76 (+) comp29605_c0_seq2:74-301(+)